MSSNGVTHEFVVVTRPPQHVRGRDGMRITTNQQLNPIVCAVCGYGPTPLQRAKIDAGLTIRHRARELVEFP